MNKWGYELKKTKVTILSPKVTSMAANTNIQTAS